MNDVYFNDEGIEAVDQDAHEEHPREPEDVHNQPEVMPRRSERHIVQPDCLGAITVN